MAPLPLTNSGSRVVRRRQQRLPGTAATSMPTWLPADFSVCGVFSQLGGICLGLLLLSQLAQLIALLLQQPHCLAD